MILSRAKFSSQTQFGSQAATATLSRLYRTAPIRSLQPSNVPTSVLSGPMAYNPDKGEIYINEGASVAIISDKTNNVVGTVNTNGTISSSEGIAYDSGTSTVYAINNPGSLAGYMGSLAVISDPSSSTGTSNPTSTLTSSTGTSSSASPATSPTVPEFSSPALALIAAALVAATLCTVCVRKKETAPRYPQVTKVNFFLFSFFESEYALAWCLVRQSWPVRPRRLADRCLLDGKFC